MVRTLGQGSRLRKQNGSSSMWILAGPKCGYAMRSRWISRFTASGQRRDRRCCGARL